MHRHLRGALLAVALPALVGLFVPTHARASIVINEIMYDSNYTPDIEWVELYNTGPSGQNITDWYMLDDNNAHPKCHFSGTLGVGQYIVVASDTAVFRARYPLVTNLNPAPFDQGGLGFGLGNSGDQVRIYNDDGVLVDSVAYLATGAWPGSPKGTGPSLELVNPMLDNSLGTSWLPSTPVGGTPGVVNSVYAGNAAPICDNGKRNIDLPKATDAVTITVHALDPENHLGTVTLWVNTGAGYVSQSMYDDGLHGDGAAGDSIFGAVIAAKPNGTVVKYYASAKDNLNQTNNWPDGAPVDYRAYTVGYTLPRVAVNEILADNTEGVFDDKGARDDWMELYNPGTSALDLGGLYLTDDLTNGNKWQIPSGISIPAGGYLVFWCDGGDTLVGPMHTNFKFSGDGEEVGVFSSRDCGDVQIHGWKFGAIGANVAVGFKPDYPGVNPTGITLAPEYLAWPTPGTSNNPSPYFSSVCINEFATSSYAGGDDDWIELYNRGAAAYDLGGAYLSDNRTLNTKYQFPSGTTLAAGQYLVLTGVQLGFNLSTSGEVVQLTAADSLNGLDFYDFKAERPDTSEGRSPDGVGRWGKFHPSTPGTHNVGALAVGASAPFRAPLGALKAAPNPCRPNTEISFSLGKSDVVMAAIYDPAGRRVRVVHHGALAAGNYAMLWNGRDDAGRSVAAGLYFLRVSTSVASQSCRLLVLQ